VSAFPPLVERWRAVALVNAPDLPVELVLAFIDAESRGKVGDVAYTDVSHRYEANRYSDAERACGLPASLAWRALGLMQVAPRTWRSYVAKSHDSITPCDLASKETAAGGGQIRAGAYALRSALRFAGWKGEPRPSDPIVLLARLAYARGEPATTAKLAAARAAGYPATFEGLEAFDPTWGRPDHPFAGARRILAKYRHAIGEGPPPIIKPPGDPDSVGGGGGVVLLALVALAAWYAFK
jgi:hypothetical protein